MALSQILGILTWGNISCSKRNIPKVYSTNSNPKNGNIYKVTITGHILIFLNYRSCTARKYHIDFTVSSVVEYISLDGRWKCVPDKIPTPNIQVLTLGLYETNLYFCRWASSCGWVLTNWLMRKCVNANSIQTKPFACWVDKSQHQFDRFFFFSASIKFPLPQKNCDFQIIA